MKRSVIGILAHVDAGKTTLAEALLYKTGKIRKLGRVDSGNTALDTHSIERERGITVFAGQAKISTQKLDISLLDTPGHVDFSTETERILSVLDYAILVISGTDGVQSHTKTLWKLLKIYNIPTMIFVTKMDYARKSESEVMSELKSELSDLCINFSSDSDEKYEALAMCREDTMDDYLSTGVISDDKIADIIACRLTFPCFFGSGLKLIGIDEFIYGLESLIVQKTYPENFGAKVFKISHDKTGAKLTHIKITGGTLNVRDTIVQDGKEEKVAEIRIYSGAKYTNVETANSGETCIVLGLNETYIGQGLGNEVGDKKACLEPVMNYKISLPSGESTKTFMPKLRLIEEEEPMMNIGFNEQLQEISVSLMGEVQAEILKSIISERFGIMIDVGCGHVQYKETITSPVEGIGHYEPLRHYAEVHVLITPTERGSGITFENKCNNDMLDPQWQRLAMMHLREKQHLGVLTGSPLTDVKLTLVAGRAHIKHTDGGDFRQAVYRAVRQGLMRAESVILEPYYEFHIEVPRESIGRAISDVKMRYGKFSPPEDNGEMSVLRGTAPVDTMNSYPQEIASYTSGRGRIRLSLCGYDICHDQKRAIDEYAYDPCSDMENTPDSVFCAHGGGFLVKWNNVEDYMHIDSVLTKEAPIKTERRNFRIEDKELEAIMEREFGPARTTQTLYRYAIAAEKNNTEKAVATPKKRYVIVDGYNCIFAWDGLSELSKTDIDGAREQLCDILCNYAAFTGSEVIVVFDAYLVRGGIGEKFERDGIKVVYTKERQTADNYIEGLIDEIGKNENVRIVTSDAMIQRTTLIHGTIRVSSLEFLLEVKATAKKISDFITDLEMRSKMPTVPPIPTQK